MPALQGGAAWAEERLLGALRQSVLQNGRVHLHIIAQDTSPYQGRLHDDNFTGSLALFLRGSS